MFVVLFVMCVNYWLNRAGKYIGCSFIVRCAADRSNNAPLFYVERIVCAMSSINGDETAAAKCQMSIVDLLLNDSDALEAFDKTAVGGDDAATAAEVSAFWFLWIFPTELTAAGAVAGPVWRRSFGFLITPFFRFCRNRKSPGTWKTTFSWTRCWKWKTIQRRSSSCPATMTSCRAQPPRQGLTTTPRAAVRRVRTAVRRLHSVTPGYTIPPRVPYCTPYAYRRYPLVRIQVAF